jgi:Fe-Mn family superoxide dismutase
MAAMNLQINDLPFDPAGLQGLTETLVRSHHQNNYGGAVKRLNAIRAWLRDLSFASAPGFEINGLKREELIANNSMVLHELYFASMACQPAPMEPAMALALQGNFGSLERWKEEFVAMGKALGGGSGWVLLVFQPRDGSLVNQWASDHTQAAAGGVPLLALDMYEHAYHMDYGAAAGQYVDAFMETIDWTGVYGRYRQAVEAASEAFAATQEDVASAQVIDVRRRGVYEQADGMIPDASWKDPALVASWESSLQPGQPVIVYCVYGHEVGRATALRLRAAGHDARFLRGGMAGWEAGGRPVRPRE